MRTYKPRASATLPVKWVNYYQRLYQSRGHKVTVTLVKEGEAKIQIEGVSREEFCQLINDPLGEPGKQKTRHPLASTHRRKRKTKIHPWDQAFIDEEKHYSRPL